MFGPLFRKTIVCGCVALFNVACVPLFIGLELAAHAHHSLLWLIPLMFSIFWMVLGVPFAGSIIQKRFKHNPDDPPLVRWMRNISSFEWFDTFP